jgi:hypothetical protein
MRSSQAAAFEDDKFEVDEEEWWGRDESSKVEKL